MATAAAKSYGDEGMDLFDQIDDLLDFPNDDDVMGPIPVDPACGGHVGIGDGPDPFDPLAPPLDDDDLLAAGDAPGNVAGAGNGFGREEDKLGQCDDLDMAQLEWLSTFFDDTTDNFSLDFPSSIANDPINGNSNNDFSNLMITSNSGSSNGKEESPFRTPSPVSVLETNSLSAGGSIGSASSSSSSSSTFSSSGGSGSSARALAAPPEPAPVVPARARSKRPRPATFSPRVVLPFLPPTSVPQQPPSSEPEAFAESAAAPVKKKKKEKKAAAQFYAAAAGDGGSCAAAAAPAPPAVRKCMHCEIQKTPQWRAGPMGPKTLCNACGVRYKSGRLFPEYRPAASPTFCPTIHSNSHKKVVEMRIKATEGAHVDGCDLLEYIRRRD